MIENAIEVNELVLMEGVVEETTTDKNSPMIVDEPVKANRRVEDKGKSTTKTMSEKIDESGLDESGSVEKSNDIVEKSKKIV